MVLIFQKMQFLKNCSKITFKEKSKGQWFFWLSASCKLQVNWNLLKNNYTESKMPQNYVFTIFLKKKFCMTIKPLKISAKIISISRKINLNIQNLKIIPNNQETRRPLVLYRSPECWGYVKISGYWGKKVNIESEWFGPRSLNDLDLWYSYIFMYSFSWPSASTNFYITDYIVSQTSSPKGNDRSPESNVPRSNLISKNSNSSKL